MQLCVESVERLVAESHQEIEKLLDRMLEEAAASKANEKQKWEQYLRYATCQTCQPLRVFRFWKLMQMLTEHEIVSRYHDYSASHVIDMHDMIDQL